MLRSAAIRAFNGSNKQVRLLVGMLSLPNRTLSMILKKQWLLLVFPLHFFRALAASCMSMLHSRTEYSQDFLICQNPSSESVALVLTGGGLDRWPTFSTLQSWTRWQVARSMTSCSILCSLSCWLTLEARSWIWTTSRVSGIDKLFSYYLNYIYLFIYFDYSELCR